MVRLIDTKEGKIIIGFFIIISIFFLSKFESDIPFFMVYVNKDSSFFCDLSKNLCEFHISSSERFPAGTKEFIKFYKYDNPFYYMEGHKCGYPHGLWIEADRDTCLEIGGQPDTLICFNKKFKDICWIHNTLNERISKIDYKTKSPIGVSRFVKEGILTTEAYEDIRGFTISFTIPLTERKKVTVYKLENNTCIPYRVLEGDELKKDFYETLDDCESNIIRKKKYYRYNQTLDSCEEIELYPGEITPVDFKTFEECDSYTNKKDKKYSSYFILIIILIIFMFIWREVKAIRASKV